MWRGTWWLLQVEQQEQTWGERDRVGCAREARCSLETGNKNNVPKEKSGELHNCVTMRNDEDMVVIVIVIVIVTSTQLQFVGT